MRTESAICSRRQLFGSNLCSLYVTEVRPDGASGRHVVGLGQLEVLALTAPPRLTLARSLIVALAAVLATHGQCAARMAARP
jgi:hypothetical protein